MNEILQQIAEVLELGPGAEGRLIRSAAIIIILGILHIVFLRLIRNQDIQFRYRWRKISTYIAVALGILLVGRVWFEGVQTLATFIGILGAGLVIALRDMVTNVAAWFFILWRRPFVVGDRIQIGEHRGDVIDKRIFQFTLLEIGNWVDADQSTGRIIHVPNGRIFVEPVANYTAGLAYIWNEIPVTITFESDWKAAREILLDIARRHGEHLTEEAERRLHEASRRYLIFYSTLTPTVYTSVADVGIRLTLRYLCEPRRRRGSAQAIWEDILEEFGRRDDIDFAYPTVRYYDNVVEGKPAARAAVPGGDGAGRREEV